MIDYYANRPATRALDGQQLDRRLCFGQLGRDFGVYLSGIHRYQGIKKVG